MAGSQKIYGVNLMLQDKNKEDVAQIICDEKVPFVTIGAGNPIPGKERLILLHRLLRIPLSDICGKIDFLNPVHCHFL